MLRLLEGRARTVPALLARAAERNGDRPAVVFGDEVLTHADAVRDARRFAGGLAELGVRAGDPVAIMLGNSLDFCRVWFATNWLGAVEVPVNTDYRDEGLRYIVEHSEAQVLIVEDSYLERLEAIAGGLTHLRHIVVRGSEGGAVTVASLPFTTHRFAELAGAAELAGEPGVVAGDLAAIMYTSGTTGPPKGVLLPHGAAVTWAEQTAERLGLISGETHYCSFPLFHTLAQYFATLPAIGVDGTVAIGRRFSASTFWDEIRATGATSANMMGAVVSILHSRPRSEGDADNPLRIAFGAPVPASIMDDFQARFGLTFVEIYGSSEANVVLWNPLDDVRPGSCGKPIGRFDVRLVDGDDLDVATGQVGEIVTRPHEPHSMMAGYYRNPEATATAFRNLWFHTGDLARRDADGYHYFVDRAKDAIRRRGENISSWEIETVLARHEDVAESAAFGVPSELTEEDVMVVVAPREGAALTVEDLIAYCEHRLPPYMVPRYVELTPALPRTSTGKIQKYALREQGPTPSTWDREKLTAGGVR